MTVHDSIVILAIRSFEEEGKARMGVVECLNHNLVEAFHILHEKEGVCVNSVCVGVNSVWV